MIGVPGRLIALVVYFVLNNRTVLVETNMFFVVRETTGHRRRQPGR